MAESDGYFNVVMNLDEFNISNKTLFYFNLNPQIGMTVTDISSVLYSLSIILLEPAPHHTLHFIHSHKILTVSN